MGCFSQWLLLNEKYALLNFMHEHDHSDAGLNELRSTIIMYGPSLSGMLFYKALLSQLRMLERDLHIRGLLEELVLVPRALTIEVDLTLKLGKMAKFNLIVVERP